MFCNAPLGTDQNQVSISYVGDTIAVTFRLANAITNFIPTIDGAFRFIPQGDGTFYVEGRRDPYPSLSVVLSRNGVNTIMLQRDETKTRELSDWFGLRDMFALCIPPQ